MESSPVVRNKSRKANGARSALTRATFRHRRFLTSLDPRSTPELPQERRHPNLSMRIFSKAWPVSSSLSVRRAPSLNSEPQVHGCCGDLSRENAPNDIDETSEFERLREYRVRLTERSIVHPVSQEISSRSRLPYPVVRSWCFATRWTSMVPAKTTDPRITFDVSNRSGGAESTDHTRVIDACGRSRVKGRTTV